MEADARSRMEELEQALDENPKEARAILHHLFHLPPSRTNEGGGNSASPEGVENVSEISTLQFLEESDGSTDPKPVDHPPQIARVAQPSAQPGEGVTVTVDVVTEALATALARASADGRWDIVGQLARELEARRLAQGESRPATVVDLDRRRSRSPPR